MPRPLPLHDPAGTIPESAEVLAGQVTIYDPAMCCPTGLCGPSVDPALLALSRDVRWLEKQGAVVERFGLSQEPGAFVQQPRIAGLMQAFGDTALPATLVNGAVLVHGRYPSREEIVAALRADTSADTPSPAAGNGGCACAPGSSCD